MTNDRKPEKDLAQVFACRLQEARNARGWSQQRLADEMKKLGAKPDDRATITKIERAAAPQPKGRKGEARKVSLSEAVAFAVALGVPLLSLLLPRQSASQVATIEEVAIAPQLTIPAFLARAWMLGDLPLKSDDIATYREARSSLPRHLTPVLVEWLLKQTSPTEPTRKALWAYLEDGELSVREGEEVFRRFAEMPDLEKRGIDAEAKDAATYYMDAALSSRRDEIGGLRELLEELEPSTPSRGRKK